MALTAEQLDRLVDTLAAIYDDAELRILEHIARQLAQGLDSPDWAMTKLRELQLLQARLKGNLDALVGKSAEEITKAILDAYNSGRAEALADLVRAKLAKDAARDLNPVEDLAMRSLLTEAIGATLGMHPRILRSVDDVYRQVVAKAAGVMLTGAQTRRQVAQRALDEFADRGVTGFTDRAGRNWEMRSYAEMALRSASHRASTQGHLDQLQAQGHDLVIVSDHSQECELCRPFEGKVLSISGAPRIDGVQVLCTVAEAYHRGYGHPGCRHRFKAYFPGITTVPKGTADPTGDANRQEQRRLERGVRAWKRREAAALDPQAKQAAVAKGKEWRAKLAQHVADNDLKAQPFRTNPRAAR